MYLKEPSISQALVLRLSHLMRNVGQKRYM